MASLAALPSTSVAVVVARTGAKGFWGGVATTAGVVCGDLLYLSAAAFGLVSLARNFGPVFVVVKLLGGAYLIWLGIGLWKSAGPATGLTAERGGKCAHAAGFSAGLLVTLADVKAIAFYAGLLPAFVDVEALRTGDFLALAVVTILAVGGVKLLYAAFADRLLRSRAFLFPRRFGGKAVGAVLMCAGLWLIGKG